MKKIFTVVVTTIALMLFDFKIFAILVPDSADIGTVVRYENNQFTVLKGNVLLDKTIDYPVKDGDIITYSQDRLIDHVYSKFDTQHSINGELLMFLYPEMKIYPNFKQDYVFVENKKDCFVLLNQTNYSFAIIDNVETINNTEFEIITKYTILDRKFNTIYRIKDISERKLVKTQGDVVTSLFTESKENVYYEPQN